MLTRSFHPSSWEEYFLSHPSHAEFNDNLPTLFESFDGSDTAISHFTTATSSPEIPFLIVDPVHNDIIQVHNFLTARGNLLHRHSTHMIHAAISTDPSIPLTVLPDKLFTPISLTTPATNTLLAATSIDALNSIPSGPPGADDTAPHIQLCSCIPVPPLLIDTLLAGAIPKPDHLFVAILEALTAYDATRPNPDTEGDDDDNASFTTQCLPLLHWLHAASHNQIPPTPTTPTLTASELSMSKQTHTHLLPGAVVPSTPVTTPGRTTTPGHTTTPLLTTTDTTLHQTEQADILSRIADAMENRSSSSKSFKALQPSLQTMILNMASDDHHQPAPSLPTTASDFFKSRSSAAAASFLETELHKLGVLTRISHALAHSLLSGKFTWDNLHTPSGLASSTVQGCNAALQSSSLAEAIVLDLKIQRHSLDDDTITKLTKQQIIFPSHLADMKHTFECLNGIVQVLLGPNAYIHHQIDSFIAHLRLNHHRLILRAQADKLFIARLMVCFDDRLNQWMTDCLHQPIHMVDSSLVDFPAIISQIRLSNFHYDLPPSIRAICPDRNFHTPTRPTNKRKIDQTPDDRAPKRTTIENHNPDTRWCIKTTESWNDFAGKFPLERPHVNGKRVCIRFLLRHFCFQDCPCYHGPIKTTTTSSALDTYMAKIRKSN